MSEIFGYGLITKHVAFNPEITADAKAVYTVLCSLADERGFCYPLVKTIRTYTGLSEYKFHNAMQNLREHGVVQSSQQKEGTTFARNTYQLLDRPHLKKSSAESEKNSTPRTQNIPEDNPPHPKDLGINQYQNNTNTRILNTTQKNIYVLLGEKLTEKRKQAGITKGKLTDSQTARMYIDGLLKSGFTEEQLLNLADRFPAGRCYDSWWHFEKFCLSERGKG